VSIVNVHTYRDDILTVEKVSFAELAELYGSPLYVYSKKSILDEIRHVEQGFDGMPHATYYAVKANANPQLLRLIASEGLGADVGSRGELFLALRAGFPASKITFSGVGKRDDEILYALEQHVHAYYVESTQEIEVLNELAGQAGVRARILLRVNLDIDAGGHAYVSTSLRHNKFGMPHAQAVDELKKASLLPHIEVCGIHSHVGSQITKAAVFVKAAEAVAGIIQTIRDAGVPVQDLDFGGGFGIQYHGYINHRGVPVEHAEEAHLSTTELVRASLPVLRSTGCALSIQPGRCIVAYAGVLLTRAIYRKETKGKTFLIVDGAMNDLIRPSLYHAHHQIVPVRLTGAPYEAVDVVGPVCESGDFFAHDRRLPRMDRGDLLALMCAGAYGYAQASTYNARPRPAEILVDGASHTVIRPRETLEQL
jgi:diaminopimelate decarboxylase